MAHAAEKMQCRKMKEDRESYADAVARYFGSLKLDTIPVHGKSMEESTRLREQGNAAYKRQYLSEALRKYTRSIATAPCDGNTTGLALAFADRSAVHFSLKNYDDCLSDIKQALKVNYPSKLISKVFKSRAECYLVMGNMEAARANLRKAVSCCLEEDKKRSMEQELAALKPPEQVYNPRLRVRPPPKKYLGENSMIPGASACIEIKHNEKYGRHLVATKDIPPGVVLIVEEPFGSVLRPHKCDEYCFRCMRRSSAMIPCKSCTNAMYCSETCRDLSWTESHDLECAVLMKLVAADSPIQSMLVLRLFIVALKKHGNLQQLYGYVRQLDSEEGNNVCDAEGRFDGTGLRAFYNLEQRKMPKAVRDEYAKRCAFLVDCIEEKSQLLHGLDNELKRFTGGLLLRFMSIINAINSFLVQDWAFKETDAIGSVMYPICSLINHGCISNAMQYQRGNTMVMLAILPIVKGEQVFISYHGEKCGVDRARLEMLQVEDGYGFKCGCRGCTDPLSACSVLPRCPTCKTTVNTISRQMVKCPQCYQHFHAGPIISAAFALLGNIAQMHNQPRKLANIPVISDMITKLHRSVFLSNTWLYLAQGLLHSGVTQAGLGQID